MLLWNRTLQGLALRVWLVCLQAFSSPLQCISGLGRAPRRSVGLEGFSHSLAIRLIPERLIENGKRNLKRPTARTEFRCHDNFDHHCSRNRLSVPDRCGVTAKRQKRRPGCGIRWTGQPDSIWTTGCGLGAFPGNDVVSHYFHDHIHYALDLCGAPDWAFVGALGREAIADKFAAEAGSVNPSNGSSESGTDSKVSSQFG